MALDADNDGDLDVAVVSAYNAWSDPAASSLIWLENNGRQQLRCIRSRMRQHISSRSRPRSRRRRRRNLVTGGMHISAPYDRMSRVTLWTNRGAHGRSIARPCPASGLGTRASEASGRLRTGTTNERAPSGDPSLESVRAAPSSRILLRVYPRRVKIRKSRYLSRLPPLPTFSTPAHRAAHISKTPPGCSSAPASAEAVGALGLGYHDSMFYEEADRSYAIAEEFGTGSDVDLKESAYSIPGRTTAPCSYRRAVIRAAARPPFGARGRPRARVQSGMVAGGEAEFKLGRRDAAVAASERARILPEPAPAEPAAGRRRETPARPFGVRIARPRARGARRRRRRACAAKILEEVTATAPAFGPGMRLRGNTYAALGRGADAQRAVRRADRIPGYDPYVDPTFALLARQSRSPTFLLQQAAAADAGTNGAWREYLYRRALELDPGNTDALEELGTLLRVLRRFEEALDVLRRLEQLVPDDPRLVGDNGRCLSGSRRYGEAESNCAAPSMGWTMPTTVTTSGLCSTAPAGWPRR